MVAFADRGHFSHRSRTVSYHSWLYHRAVMVPVISPQLHIQLYSVDTPYSKLPTDRKTPHYHEAHYDQYQTGKKHVKKQSIDDRYKN